MRLLKTPWKSEFLSLVNESESKIRITSPFIKENICNDILKTKKECTNIELITSFKLMNLYSGALDIKGIGALINNNNTTVKNYSSLHAKIYIFDDKKAIITSSNLTNGGLVNNFEYGVLIKEKNVVYEIINDFETLFNDVNTGTIKNTDIDTVQKILAQIQNSEKKEFPHFSLESESDLVLTNVKNISNSLNGWQKEVFLSADKIDKQVFDLNDMYFYENEFSRIYPKNKNIKDKIRQQLQVLRDLSLIEFLGNGIYKKLWKHYE